MGAWGGTATEPRPTGCKVPFQGQPQPPSELRRCQAVMGPARCQVYPRLFGSLYAPSPAGTCNVTLLTLNKYPPERLSVCRAHTATSGNGKLLTLTQQLWEEAGFWHWLIWEICLCQAVGTDRMAVRRGRQSRAALSWVMHGCSRGAVDGG